MQEEEKKLIKPNEVVDYLNASYLDKETRELLFGAEEVSLRNIRGAQPLLRLVLAGALFSFIYWKENKNDIKEDQKTPEYLKVEELCESLFQNDELNLNSSIYLLFEIRRDVLKNGNKSFFGPIMDLTDECEFGKVYGLLDEWNSSKERILVYYKNYHIFYFLKVVTECLRILREADISIDKEDVSFVFAKKNYKCEKYVKFDAKDQYFYILQKDNDQYYDLKNLVKR